MQTTHTQPDDLAQLRKIAEEFAEGFNTGDVDRIMRFYGETYVDVNLRNPVQSWAERRAYYAQVIERGGFRVAVRPDDIQVHSEFAFVRGTLELIRLSGAADSARTELRYLEIVRRQRDGSWKVIWGMDGPVQEYTPAG
ncbi:MAG TPA: nuclear transport factor 2 family protein [Candidatus Acidoferrum sp.]|nr:nuclear transport factor 2 family protein [Candidatus Acidoferrum sp.]